jgi:NRAMP (natural resistance-associated macrophage protein)-like metal ion transporter
MPSRVEEPVEAGLEGARPRRRLSWNRRLAIPLALMGPGLLTGIVDNDPTGIAGYSIAGSHFGYSMLWALLLSAVALATVQQMVARMGAVTGKGLADLIRERFGVSITLIAMLTLLVANAATTVAEFAGVAGASEIFGISRFITVPIAAAAIFLLVAYGSYRKVEVALLLVSLIFIAYLITGFIAHPDWRSVARGWTIPSFELNLPYFTVLIGLIGTTITPWAMFYNQSAVVDKGLGERDVRIVGIDAYAGSIIANVVASFIIITTAATLWAHGQPAETVDDVSKALSPLAGDFAGELFAIGLLNAALMAMAVLPLSTAYAICEAFGWERSVNRGPREAPAFFALFAGLLAIGAIAVLIPGLPLVFLLLLPNVVGGMLLPVILVLALKLVNDRRIMGRFVNSKLQNVIAGATTAVLITLSVAYLVLALLSAAGVIDA